jgi:hypothetical protein
MVGFEPTIISTLEVWRNGPDYATCAERYTFEILSRPATLSDAGSTTLFLPRNNHRLIGARLSIE